MKTSISLKSQIAAVEQASRYGRMKPAQVELQKSHLDAVIKTLTWLERNRERIAELRKNGDLR